MSSVGAAQTPFAAKANPWRSAAGMAAAVAATAGLTFAVAPQSGASPDYPEALRPFYEQQISWGSCEKFVSDFKPNPRVDCAMVRVPVDYQKPSGEAAQIAVYRLKASGQKIGSLLFNPGGPGGSGVDFINGSITPPPDGGKTLADLEIAQRFDLIGFDPRGIGASTPSVHCLTGPEQDHLRALDDVDYSPAGIARQEARNKDYTQKCVQHTGLNFLAHVGTVDVVQDMDVLRAVLGDAKLSYVGYSYGTFLGSTYAERFPTHVRAMDLDGAVDPNESPVDRAIKQAQGFETAFRAFAADCAAQASCPLGQDPTVADQKFRELVLPLIQHPAATKDGRGLSYSDAVLGTMQALYFRQLWSPLREGLTELRIGSGNILQLLADLYMERDKSGHYANVQDVSIAVRCVDEPQITDRKIADEIDVEGRKAAPFEDDERGTGHGALDQCAFWPVRPALPPPIASPPPGLPKLVVVSTTNDPATPYQAGVELARELGASLITFNGTQHTASLQGGSECVDSAVQRYLIDLVAPPDGLTC